MVFGLFVLNRVYNFYVSVLNRMCILPFVLNVHGRKMKGVVLNRVGILDDKHNSKADLTT